MNNINKSKMLVFSRGELKENLKLRCDIMLIEVMTDSYYLGVPLSRSGFS